VGGPERTFSPASERVVDGRVGSVDRRHKEGPPPPPPDAAADPEPGMIARMRRPLFVKYHSFAVCARSLPGITIGSRVKPDAPYSPLEQPGFSLALIYPSAQKGCSETLGSRSFSEVQVLSFVVRLLYDGGSEARNRRRSDRMSLVSREDPSYKLRHSAAHVLA
jgi:hypothetical protein